MHVRIGLNLLHAQRSLGGVWNYIQSIVETLQTCDTENEFFVYCNQESRSLVREQRRFHVFSTKANMNRRVVRVAYEQTCLNWLSRRDHLDVMHWFANNSSFLPGIASVSTFYDLLALNDPGAKRGVNGIYIRTMMRHAAKCAAVLSPISQVTAEDLSKWYDARPNRMVVVHPPLSRRFSPVVSAQIARFKKKYGLPEKFWVFVSVYREHKNHERLFKAFGKLKYMVTERWPLVLRCDRNGVEELLDDMVHQNRIEEEVIWLPRLDDDEMPALFSAATASVFPSLFEGGGIPVMEAMGCGCPVVASDIPTTREFAKDAALVFDPKDVESIAEAMATFQNEPKYLEECRQRGFEVVKNYRPEAIFACLMDAYKMACC